MSAYTMGFELHLYEAEADDNNYNRAHEILIIALQNPAIDCVPFYYYLTNAYRDSKKIKWQTNSRLFRIYFLKLNRKTTPI
jgi:hypothetical protein